MPMVEFAATLTDVRTGLQALREGIAAWRELRAGLKGGTVDPVTADALADRAEHQLLPAEAQVAQALGYNLCRCTWPPTIMLRVGHLPRVTPPGRVAGAPVHECPTCGSHDATPSPFVRTTPRSTRGVTVHATATQSLR